jgi:acyl-CoA thioester hydrolase
MLTASQLKTVLQGEVKQEWVDYNGHMGDYAYAIVFSDAVTAFMDLIGIDEAYRTQTLRTIYTLEMRIAYVKECHAGQMFRCQLQMIDVDAKRCHVFCRMIDAASGEDLAWSEQLLMHMQQSADGAPRALEFPPVVKARVDGLMSQHAGLARPDWVGKVIGIRRKSS